MRLSIPKFGPKHIKFLPNLDGGFDDANLSFDGLVRREDSGLRLDRGPTGPPLPTPIRHTDELAGGLSASQLDQAARMEVEEGAPITIDYGERLKSGLLVVNSFVPATPEHTFTVILGDGWGSLGGHGEWEAIVKAWYLGEELTNRFDYTEWFRDKLPAGASPQAAQDGWNWVARDPEPFLGKYSHQSPLRSGFHEHWFGYPPTFPVGSGDVITTWIYSDPTNPPSTIALGLGATGAGSKQAYWGPDNITDIASRFQINASIPAAGSWQRLDVLASTLGVEGDTIHSIGFRLFDGAATWGPIMRWKNTADGEAGYLFRPGILAHNVTDLIQGQNVAVWPSGLAYNGSANVTVRLNDDIETFEANPQDRPDAFKCRAKCRRVFNFDATGAEIDYGYSANPARVAADRILHFFEQRYRHDLELARLKFRERVYWPSWVEWRDYCDALIPWDMDGDGVIVFIPRFEAHISFTGALSLSQALNQITGLSATMWQDEGSQLIFLPPSPRAPIHHFHSRLEHDPQARHGNIVGSIGISVIDLRDRPNRFIVRGRDITDEFLGPTAIEPPEFTAEWDRRQRAIARGGGIRSERELPNMTQSQFARVITYRAQLEFHNPITYSLVGQADAFKVLPGDFVTLTHPLIEKEYQLCLVTGMRKRSVQQSADEIGFNLQRVDGQLYRDDAHGPRQGALELELP